MFNPTIHKFTIKALAIQYQTGETINLDNSVYTIAIKNNYLTNVYPLYHITLELTKENKKFLVQNDFYISLKILRVNSSLQDSFNEKDSEADSPETDKIITDILLRPFGKPKLFNTPKESDIESVEDTTENVKNQQTVLYSIDCVPFEQLQINNKILNNCYENANLNEIILNSLSEVYTGDIYYQESKNINRYDSLLIPQLSIIPLLKFLQKNYIIYSSNLSIFFTDHKLFIYDLKEKQRKYNNTMNINIELDTGNANQAKYQQIYVDENNNIKKIYDSNPVSINNEEILHYNYGDSIVFNSFDDNFNLVSRKYELSQNLKNADKKIRIHWNNNQDESFEKRDLSLFTHYVQFTFKDIDPSLIEPDTKIVIDGSPNLTDNGEYALFEKEVFFTTNDKINYNESVILNLSKK